MIISWFASRGKNHEYKLYQNFNSPNFFQIMNGQLSRFKSEMEGKRRIYLVFGVYCSQATDLEFFIPPFYRTNKGSDKTAISMQIKSKINLTWCQCMLSVRLSRVTAIHSFSLFCQTTGSWHTLFVHVRHIDHISNMQWNMNRFCPRSILLFRYAILLL